MHSWVEDILRELSLRNGRCSISEAARLAHRSTSSFRHEFKHLTGTNFRTACLMAKLERGKILLNTTALGIPEISAALGYSSRDKFEKAFKRVYGITPKQFRDPKRAGGHKDSRT